MGLIALEARRFRLTAKDNPLLKPYGLPDFATILPEHVVPAVQALIKECDECVGRLERTAPHTWAGLMMPLEEMSRRIEAVWGPVTHLLGVKNSQPLRDAYNAMQGEMVSLQLKISQSRLLFNGYKKLVEDADKAKLDQAQRRILDHNIVEARLSGIELEGKDKERFNEIAKELSTLSTQFSNNVLDATKDYCKILHDAKEVEGLPDSAKELLSQIYNQKKAADAAAGTPQSGPWAVTLDLPSLFPVLKHAKSRALREEMYRANISRAAKGTWDNTPLIETMLNLRKEKAKLLGFATYAELSVVRKMAGSVPAVEALLGELNQASRPFAQREFEELVTFAKTQGFTGKFANWDVQYYGERLREKLFSYSDEDLRPYFPLDQALNGLFKLVERLFDVVVKPADGEAQVWHKDVRFFRIFDRANKPVAAFFLDPFSRPEDKRGGAWMNVCVNRCRMDGQVVLPVAYLICNGTPPSYDKPSLLTFREVETLFHEFGHGLQHMLTTIDHYDAAGLNGIEWDAVELASQFMENWCYHKPTLMGLTKHYKTGAPLPEELFKKVTAARKFRAASDMVRQLHFGILDMELHHRFVPGGGEAVFDVDKRIATKTLVMEPLKEDRFLCSFSHIFAGGYAAGYYSYKWAEVLSADAFSAFEEAGLDNETSVAQVGKKYRDTILAMGGAEHPMAVFKRFRGREPTTAALLRHSGLAS